MITYSDGTIATLGKVIGPRGEQGIQGEKGDTGAQGEKGEQAVSYTHLTLPTNREV